MARETPPKKAVRMATVAPAKVKAQFTVKFDREEDGRWIAEVPELPGVMVYGSTQKEARAKAEALAFRVLADQRDEANKPRRRTRSA
jgi:predicted RNase H-like HicB family nuclease